jgi:cysteine desulfurase
VDALSLSAHKLHAPKGIGALYVRRGTRFQPYLVGGHQENGRRAGTENTPYIVGFGRAAELALARLADYGTRVRALRDRLEQALLALVPDVALNGAPEPRLPNTSNLAFAGIEAEALLMLLDQQEICASSGSACASGSPEPSHVLTAMGCSPARARGSVRFSLGYYSTDAEVDRLIGCLPALVAKLRRAAV